MSEDPEIRIPGSPVLSSEMWQKLLEQEGFNPVIFPVKETYSMGQQILTAISNGIIRQKQNKAVVLTSVNQDAKPIFIEKTALKQNKNNKQSEDITLDLIREKSTAYFKKLIGETLKISENIIDSSVPFENYGLDSILVGQLNNDLSKVFENVDNTLFFEYQTIEFEIIQRRAGEIEIIRQGRKRSNRRRH